MTARRKPRRAVEVTAREPASDLGPALLRVRGEVLVADVPDPDSVNRTIRRAKRAWAPDTLLRHGSISEAQWSAAARYLDAYCVGILGAREGRTDVYVDRAVGGQGPTARQLQAATDWRLMTQAVGMGGSAALTACVLDGWGVRAWAEDRLMHPSVALGRLLAALDALVVWCENNPLRCG